ncbi:E3 ubiquitin-protein ligase TRIM50-like isoform X1 [Anolis carolinensis]|uniref:E3 ubiquitin-protein ligase TRIM50-like isoform X1 n=1 Tax=Anolis carolinensis TaxID=28377 RepID=UPI002F2B5B9A
MSRKVSLDHLEDHLLCPICLEVFREPLMLPCGHSYCRPCVESLSGGPEARFLCPLCRQSAHAASSPPNVSLARLVEALRTGAHGGEEQQEQQEEESCPDHRNPLSLFCEDDRDVICGLCGTIGTHRHHRLTPLSTAYSRMKEDLSGRMTEVQEQARGLEELLGRLMNNKTRIVNESDVFKWVLRKHFQDLHRFVDEEKARFLGRVERQVGALQAGLEEQQEQAQAALERIRHLQERLTALSDQGQHAFIRKYSSLPSRSELTPPSLSEGLSSAPPAVSFQPDFHAEDVQMEVWKRLLRRVLPTPEALTLEGPSWAAGQGGRRGSLPERSEGGPSWAVGRRGFSWGRHYWEVEVGSRGSWRLGLVKASALGPPRQRARLPKSPAGGAWLVGLRGGSRLEALAGPPLPLPLPLGAPPSRLGLFLHYPAGELTFFDASRAPREMAPLYTFRGGFQGTLYPVLDLGPWGHKGHPALAPPILPRMDGREGKKDRNRGNEEEEEKEEEEEGGQGETQQHTKL